MNMYKYIQNISVCVKSMLSCGLKGSPGRRPCRLKCTIRCGDILKGSSVLLNAAWDSRVVRVAPVEDSFVRYRIEGCFWMEVWRKSDDSEWFLLQVMVPYMRPRPPSLSGTSGTEPQDVDISTIMPAYFETPIMTATPKPFSISTMQTKGLHNWKP